MKTIAELKRTNPPTISKDATLADAVRLFGESHEEFAFIVEGKKAAGIITDGDVLRAFYVRVAAYLEDLQKYEKHPHAGSEFDEEVRERAENFKKMRVSDVMTHRPRHVDEEWSLAEAVELFRKNNLKRAPVVNSKGEMTGFIKRADVAAAAMEA